MFPKLSQKAWDEIRRITPKYDFPVNYFDSVMLTDIPDVINAYTSLFDLEKYPITKDMVFEYLKDHPDYEDVLKGTESIESTPECFIFREKGFYSRFDPAHFYSVEYNLRQIGYYASNSDIIIIGEIHGWWEKGETQ